MPTAISATLEGRTIEVTHLDKRLWPDGTAKADVLAYYTAVAPLLIPHVARRPATFLRIPSGTEGPHLYQHTAPGKLPGWIRRIDKPSRSGNVKTHVALDDAPTLVVMANAYCVEIHTPQWTAETGPGVHDRIVFDLDPGEGATYATCCRVALLLRDQLQETGLTGYPATSGGKGLHVLAAVGRLPAADAVTYARTMAKLLTSAHPRLITATRGPAAREGGRVLVDWAQNTGSATTAALYTLRAKSPSPTVSLPLTWDEVDAADTGPLALGPTEALARAEELGDLARGLLEPKARPKSGMR